MEIAIQIIWWIGLIGALVATLVILKEVALLLHTLKNILQLAEATRQAAQGIGDNVEPAPRLNLLVESSSELGEVTGEIASLVTKIEQKLSTLPASISRTGS